MLKDVLVMSIAALLLWCTVFSLNYWTSIIISFLLLRYITKSDIWYKHQMETEISCLCPCPSGQPQGEGWPSGWCTGLLLSGNLLPVPRAAAALSHIATSMNSFRRGLKDWALSLASPLCLLTRSLTNKEKWEWQMAITYCLRDLP